MPGSMVGGWHARPRIEKFYHPGRLPLAQERALRHAFGRLGDVRVGGWDSSCWVEQEAAQVLKGRRIVAFANTYQIGEGKLGQPHTLKLVSRPLRSRRKGAETRAMLENEIGESIIAAGIHVHPALGPGLLESVYEAVLAYELRKRGLTVRCQVPIPIQYEELSFDEGFRADLIVNDRVIVELKSVAEPNRAHRNQIQTYLRLSQLRLWLSP